MIRATPAIAAVLLLAGCSGGSDNSSNSGHVIDPDYEWQTSLGCDVIGTMATDELFVKDKYVCQLPGPDANVYTFTNSDAKDNWRDIADQFGTVVLNEGDTWVATKD